MTASGLPLCLEKSLGTLLQDNALTSWQIFSKESGELTVTIKLQPHDKTHNGDQQSTGGWYKKGQTKLRRDKQRWIDYQARQKTNTKTNEHLNRISNESSSSVDGRGHSTKTMGTGGVCRQTDSEKACVMAEQEPKVTSLLSYYYPKQTHLHTHVKATPSDPVPCPLCLPGLMIHVQKRL